MMKFRLGLLGLTLTSALALAAFSANAADMYVPSAPGGYKDGPLPVYTWTGFYAGVQGGWSGIDDKQALSSPTFALPVHDSPDGGVFGGHAGYNFQAGKIVFGVEGDFEGNTTDSKFVIGTPFVNTTGSERLEWQASVRGRLGWAVDRALLYGTGGWAVGQFSDKYNTAGTTFHETVDSTRNGWTLGGGIEYALGHNLSARVEYRYTDWGNHTNHLNVFLAPPGISKDEITEQTVRVGISYHISPSYEPLK
jgi:outer membrane immunogenic protein